MYLEILLYSYALVILFYEDVFHFFSYAVWEEDLQFIRISPNMSVPTSAQRTDPVNITDKHMWLYMYLDAGNFLV